MNKPKIGLALGSGSARGLSHIGIISELAKNDIHPDIVCGTSIGALVGAAYVAGNLGKLEKWVKELSKMETARFFDIGSSLRGFVNINRMNKFFHDFVVPEELKIEEMPKKFAAVATDLEAGREIWFTEGSVIDAIWASISIPGLFPAVRNDGKWLIDGAIVNPVPVSLCRALGADVVIAVNLNDDIVGKHFVLPEKKGKQEKKNGGVTDMISSKLKEYTGQLFSQKEEKDDPPGLLDAIFGAINIAQERITRSRLAGDPPDILIAPRLSTTSLLDFYKANEMIEEGKKCVNRLLPDIKKVCGKG